MRKFVPFVLATVIGFWLATRGATEYARGAPTAEWLPGVTFGVTLIIFPLAVALALRVGENPLSVDGFTLAHWTAVAGFGLWGFVGLAYLAVGYRTTTAWGNAVVGVGGMALVLRERHRRS